MKTLAVFALPTFVAVYNAPPTLRGSLLLFLTLIHRFAFKFFEFRIANIVTKKPTLDETSCYIVVYM